MNEKASFLSHISNAIIIKIKQITVSTHINNDIYNTNTFDRAIRIIWIHWIFSSFTFAFLSLNHFLLFVVKFFYLLVVDSECFSSSLDWATAAVKITCPWYGYVVVHFNNRTHKSMCAPNSITFLMNLTWHISEETEKIANAHKICSVPKVMLIPTKANK